MHIFIIKTLARERNLLPRDANNSDAPHSAVWLNKNV